MKKGRIIFIIMLLMVILLACSSTFLLRGSFFDLQAFNSMVILSFQRWINPKVPIVYKESNRELNNPARGFYVQIKSSEIERVEEIKKDSIDLVLVTFDIKNYKNIEISEEKLKELEAILKKAREHNISVIFRAVYGFNENYKDPENEYTIYKHIEQIAPVINANKDVILSVQAGFIGPWGEWHSSKYLTSDEKEIKFRNQLLMVLLENLNKDIIVNVRRPRFLRDAIAYGVNSERLGIHNDALLSTINDMGTYDDSNYTRLEELEWSNVNMAHGVNGGEMPLVSEYSSINNAVREMKSLHLTYLNSNYNKDVLDSWKNSEYNGQNGLEYINNHLGYRLWLEKVVLPQYIKSGSQFSFNMVMYNSGFAPIGKYNRIYLILYRGEQVILKSELEGDISSIYGDIGKQFDINAYIPNLSMDIKEDILVGIYISKSYEADKAIDQIELGNPVLLYKDGVNFIAKYKFGNNKYILEQE